MKWWISEPMTKMPPTCPTMSTRRHSRSREASATGAFSSLCAALSRQHNDTNVLCLGAKIIGTLISTEIVKTWMTTDAFTAEKYVKRVAKVKDINDRHCVPVK